jgi:hypothetical protein
MPQPTRSPFVVSIGQARRWLETHAGLARGAAIVARTFESMSTAEERHREIWRATHPLHSVQGSQASCSAMRDLEHRHRVRSAAILAFAARVGEALKIFCKQNRVP